MRAAVGKSWVSGGAVRAAVGKSWVGGAGCCESSSGQELGERSWVL